MKTGTRKVLHFVLPQIFNYLVIFPMQIQTVNVLMEHRTNAF